MSIIFVGGLFEIFLLHGDFYSPISISSPLTLGFASNLFNNIDVMIFQQLENHSTKNLDIILIELIKSTCSLIPSSKSPINLPTPSFLQISEPSYSTVMLLTTEIGWASQNT